MAVDSGERLVAEATLGGVDDPLAGEIVGGREDKPEVGDGIADLGPLVEAETADDLVAQPDRDEPLLELAGLELGADEDGDLVEGAAANLMRLDFLADPARLFRSIPNANDPDLLAVAGISPQSLSEPPGIVGDEPVGRGEDVAGRAVI